MKKTAFAALAVALMMGVAACSDNKSADSTDGVTNDSIQRVAVDPGEGFSPATNIRYVDMDSLLLKYNLAKDVNDFMRKQFSDLEQARRVREAEIQKFAQQIDEKMRSNGYLTEQSYNADMQKLQKMQQDAQYALASLQDKAQQEIDVQQQQLSDSVQTFLVNYNKTRHYDAILMKSAGLYFNPALDITNEVVDGLNARYNKVSQ